MTRTLLALTDGQVGNLRSAIRTAQEENCGRAVWNRLQALLDRLDNAPRVAKRDWAAYERAAGELLEAGDDQDCEAAEVNSRACFRFADVMNAIFRRR